MEIGLLVGYETWPPIGWLHAFVIGWSKYGLGLPSALLHYGLTWPEGIPTVFQTPVTVALHSPNGRQLPAVRAVPGDYERVYAHTYWHDNGSLHRISDYRVWLQLYVAGFDTQCFFKRVCFDIFLHSQENWLNMASLYRHEYTQRPFVVFIRFITFNYVTYIALALNCFQPFLISVIKYSFYK